MGIYLRKGFNFGPLRFNLSRSGLGTSVGVKGFRIGIGPRGTYLHAGRSGLYYRQSLGPRPGRTPAAPPEMRADPLRPIDSADVQQMVNASAEELLAELNRVASRTAVMPLVVLLVTGLLLFELYLGAAVACAVTMVLGVASVALARRRDILRGTAVLDYDLDAEAEARFDALKTAFTRFAGCEGLWHVEAAGRTDDWKRNAGANEVVRRRTIRAGMGAPERVVANVEVPMLPAGRQRLYLLPDQVLVYDGTRVGAVHYSDLRLTVYATAFREEGPVPKDAGVVGRTWMYINKKGGPDRRFSNNRELPILQYGVLHFESASGLRERFQCSRLDAAEALARALTRMAGR